MTSAVYMFDEKSKTILVFSQGEYYCIPINCAGTTQEEVQWMIDIEFTDFQERMLRND